MCSSDLLLPYCAVGSLYDGNSELVFAIAAFFFYAASVNIGLAVFNLIPIPPLDGSRILNLIIPSKYYFKIMKYERYIILGVFALLFFGVLDAPLSAITSAVTKLFIILANLPFSLIK